MERTRSASSTPRVRFQDENDKSFYPQQSFTQPNTGYQRSQSAYQQPSHSFQQYPSGSPLPERSNNRQYQQRNYNNTQAPWPRIPAPPANNAQSYGGNTQA